MDFPNSIGDWALLLFVTLLLLFAMFIPNQGWKREGATLSDTALVALVPVVATLLGGYLIATSEFDYSPLGRACWLILLLGVHTWTCRILETTRRRR